MNRKKYITRYLLFLLLVLLTSTLTHAQEQKESYWQVRGFLDSYHAIRSQKPGDLMSSRTRIRGEVSKIYRNSSIFLSFNATYNSILKNRTGIELRELYIDHRAEKWGFRIGRQLIIWGRADGLRITDLISPMDMTEFLAQDYDDIRMPVNALRFLAYNNIMKLDVVLVPTFQPFRLPVEKENPWSIFPKNSFIPLIWNGDTNKPKTTVSNIEYATRLSFTLPGIDFSIVGLYTWNKLPVISYNTTPTVIEISPKYYRMGVVGGDFAKPLGACVIRGEVALNFSKHFSYLITAKDIPQKGFNTVNYLLGVDWFAPHDWMLSAQFSSESIFNHKSFVEQDRNSSLLTLSISKLLLENTLKLANFTYFDITHKGWFSRFSGTYDLNDQIKLTIGYDWFHGKKGFFAQYNNNSEVWIKAKYSF